MALSRTDWPCRRRQRRAWARSRKSCEVRARGRRVQDSVSLLAKQVLESNPCFSNWAPFYLPLYELCITVIVWAGNIRLPKTHVGSRVSPSVLAEPNVSCALAGRMLPFAHEHANSNALRLLLSKNAETADSGKFPKLHVLERTDGRAGRWSVVHTLYPLLQEQESGEEQVLLTAEVRIAVDPATGDLRLSRTDGALLQTRRSRIKLVLYAVLFVILLLAVPNFYSQWQQRRQVAEFDADVAWVVDTYQRLNPAKLAASPPDWPARLVRKHQDKMWVLHRQIAKEYKVEPRALRKPPSVLDSDL